MKLNKKGYMDIIQVVIITGITGAIFIMWTFVWKEVEYQQREGELAQVFAQLQSGNGVEDDESDNDAKNPYGQPWTYYTSDEHSFSFSYPEDWTLELESGNNYDSSIVSVVSEESKKSGYADDFSVYIYDSVQDIYENKINNFGAETVDEFINKDTGLIKIGDINIDGISGTEVTWGGNYSSYVIFVENDEKLYLLWFSGANKERLTEDEARVLQSFVFTKDSLEIVRAVRGIKDSPNVIIDKFDGSFARGMKDRGTYGSGAAWFASKKDGVWTVDEITQEYPCYEHIFNVYPRDFFNEAEIEYCEKYPY